MNGVLRDIRYALRDLGRSPGFAAVAIATLATSEFAGNGVADAGLSTPELDDYRERAGIFEQICGIFPINANLTEADQPERVEALIADSNYFHLLGASAAMGPALSAVALAACALPARRAARLDPIVALRQD